MDRFLQDCLMRIDPFVKEDEIEEARMVNDFDVLFVFKNGRRILIDSDTYYFRELYPEDHELTDEQRRYEFKRRLRTMMRRKNINQEELARCLGTTQTVISRYVTGESVPSYIVMEKIAEILNCSMDDFRYKHY